MERVGFKIDTEHLRRAELHAIKDHQEAKDTFLKWVYSTQEDALDFNASSTPQIQQLLFAPYHKKGEDKFVVNPDDPFDQSTLVDYHKAEVEVFRVENNSGFIKEGGKAPLRYRDMAIRGFGLEPISYTEKGMPQADANVIRKLAGKDPANGDFGEAYRQMEQRGKPEQGK